jgi:hypothetical protein
MKLNGCLPRSGRCTVSATSHNAPLARRNQGMMLLRSSIRSNAAAAKSRRLSQAKKRYVSVVGRLTPTLGSIRHQRVHMQS